LIKKWFFFFFGGVPLFYIMYSHQGMGLGIPERSAPSAPEGALMLGNAPRPPRLRRYHTHKRLPMDDDEQSTQTNSEIQLLRIFNMTISFTIKISLSLSLSLYIYIYMITIFIYISIYICILLYMCWYVYIYIYIYIYFEKSSCDQKPLPYGKAIVSFWRDRFSLESVSYDIYYYHGHPF